MTPRVTVMALPSVLGLSADAIDARCEPNKWPAADALRLARDQTSDAGVLLNAAMIHGLCCEGLHDGDRLA